MIPEARSASSSRNANKEQTMREIKLIRTKPVDGAKNEPPLPEKEVEVLSRTQRRGHPASLFLVSLIFVGVAQLMMLTTPARADTQWFGSYQGKTYRTDFDYYAVGFVWGVGGWIYEYCGGGVWGETYYGGSGSSSALWTDSKELVNGSFQWVYKGYSYSSSPSTYVHKYNGHCSRGATDHYPNGSYVGTTSDGF